MCGDPCGARALRATCACAPPPGTRSAKGLAGLRRAGRTQDAGSTPPLPSAEGPVGPAPPPALCFPLHLEEEEPVRPIIGARDVLVSVKTGCMGATAG